VNLGGYILDVDWNAFVEVKGPKLYQYFASRFEHQTADDLVQEVLIRLVRKVQSGEFDPGKGNLMSFAYGISSFVAREQFKRKSNTREILRLNAESPADTPEDRPRPDEILQQSEQAFLLRKAISELPDIEQEIIMLVLDKDISLQEVAEISAMPLNTVKSHIHRAKQRLREKLLSKPQGTSKETYNE